MILQFGVKGEAAWPVRTSEDLVFMVAGTAPGTTVTLSGVRDRRAGD